MRKIKITHDGSRSVSAGTKVVDADTGEPVQRVRRIEIILDAADQVPEAVLYIALPEIEITAEVEIRENERTQEERIADAVVARLKNFILRHIQGNLVQ